MEEKNKTQQPIKKAKNDNEQVSKDNETIETVPLLSIGELLLIIGGLTVIIGTLFLNWVTYTNVADGRFFTESYRGIDFTKTVTPQFIEVYALPVLSGMMIAGAIFSAGRRRSHHAVPLKSISLFLRVSMFISGVLVIVIAFEVVFRFNPILIDRVGISFWDNARVGWWATMFGGIVAIIGAVLCMGKNIRKVGAVDYLLVREHADEQIPEQFPAMPQPVYIAIPRPQPRPAAPPAARYPQTTPPCPTCSKPLDYIPEYQALYCYNCQKYP